MADLPQILTHEERLRNLDQRFVKGKLSQGAFHAGYLGGSMLRAVSPEVETSPRRLWDRYIECPTDVMPQWMAAYIYGTEDEISSPFWSIIIPRFINSFSRWQILSPDAWERTKWRWFAESVLKVTKRNNKTLLSIINEAQIFCRHIANKGVLHPSKWTKLEKQGDAIVKSTPEDMATRAALGVIEMIHCAARGNHTENAVAAAKNAASTAYWYTVSLHSDQQDETLRNMVDHSHKLRAAALDEITTDLFDILDYEIKSAESVAKIK